MQLDSFPEIENFHKLPREVIVKGATSEFKKGAGVELRGIVINNIGQAVKDIRIQVVLFDEDNLPLVSQNISTEPDFLEQGGIGNFFLHLKEIEEPVSHCYFHANWSFGERV